MVTCGSRCVGSALQAALPLPVRRAAPQLQSQGELETSSGRSRTSSESPRTRTLVVDQDSAPPGPSRCSPLGGLLQQRRRASRSERALRGHGLVVETRPAAQSELAVHQAACRPAAAPAPRCTGTAASTRFRGDALEAEAPGCHARPPFQLKASALRLSGHAESAAARLESIRRAAACTASCPLAAEPRRLDETSQR